MSIVVFVPITLLVKKPRSKFIQGFGIMDIREYSAREEITSALDKNNVTLNVFSLFSRNHDWDRQPRLLRTALRASDLCRSRNRFVHNICLSSKRRGVSPLPSLGTVLDSLPSHGSSYLLLFKLLINNVLYFTSPTDLVRNVPFRPVGE